MMALFSVGFRIWSCCACSLVVVTWTSFFHALKHCGNQNRRQKVVNRGASRFCWGLYVRAGEA